MSDDEYERDDLEGGACRKKRRRKKQVACAASVCRERPPRFCGEKSRRRACREVEKCRCKLRKPTAKRRRNAPAGKQLAVYNSLVEHVMSRPDAVAAPNVLPPPGPGPRPGQVPAPVPPPQAARVMSTPERLPDPAFVDPAAGQQGEAASAPASAEQKQATPQEPVADPEAAAAARSEDREWMKNAHYNYRTPTDGAAPPERRKRKFGSEGQPGEAAPKGAAASTGTAAAAPQKPLADPEAAAAAQSEDREWMKNAHYEYRTPTDGAPPERRKLEFGSEGQPGAAAPTGAAAADKPMPYNEDVARANNRAVNASERKKYGVHSPSRMFDTGLGGVSDVSAKDVQRMQDKLAQGPAARKARRPPDRPGPLPLPSYRPAPHPPRTGPARDGMRYVADSGPGGAAADAPPPATEPPRQQFHTDIPLPGAIQGDGSGDSLTKNHERSDRQLIDQMSPWVKDGFIGVKAADELDELAPLIDKGPECGFIVNKSTRASGGTHWCAVFISWANTKAHAPELDYYDPFGDPPPPMIADALKELVATRKGLKTMLKFKINRVPNQDDRSSTCGYQAMRFLQDMFAGKTFKEATDFSIPEGEAAARELIGGKVPRFGFI